MCGFVFLTVIFQLICSYHHAEYVLQLHCLPSTALFYHMSQEERIDADNRSVYVGNVSLLSYVISHLTYS